MSLARLRGPAVDARLWTPVDEVESQALTQLRNIAALPWVAHVAVMPDVHFGKGATVGSVIAMQGAVAPAAVGVDIGCGMAAVRTSLWRGRPARRPARAAARRSRTRSRSGSTPHDEPVEAARAASERGREGASGRASASSTTAVQDLGGTAPRSSSARSAAATTSSSSASTPTDARLADAALRLAQHRQGAGRDPHRPRARKLHAQPRRCPTATSRCSSPARRRSTTTGAISTGRRTTRGSTAR